MHTLPQLIQDLAVMLCVAGLVTLLFQKIKQPVVLGYLVAGIIIGPYTPPHALVTDIPNIKTLAELGVIFLMFSLGLEFSFHKLSRVGFSATVTGLLEVIFMFLLGFAVGSLIGWSYLNCLFLGAALSISSTTIIIKAITELHLQKKRFAYLIFGILIIEDLIAVLLLVALSAIAMTKNISVSDLSWATGKLMMVVTTWFLIGYFIFPYFLKKIARFASEETITVVSVGLCLFLVVVANYFHYSSALGAFMMGSILAESPFIERLKHLIEPIRDIFAAVFFIGIGMLIDPMIIIKEWPIILSITMVTFVGKILSTGFCAFLSGQTLNTSLRTGFAMAQIGEFSFIIAGLGLVLGVINEFFYPVIVAVSVITTFTTPYSIRFSDYLVKKIRVKLPRHTRHLLNTHVIYMRNLRNHIHQTYRRLIQQIVKSK